MRRPTGGIVQGATAGAAAAFTVAWFLPWMADTAAFPLLGHAFTMWFWFCFEAPGLGVGLEMALFGLLGLVAIGSACGCAHRTSAVTAALGVPLGVHLVLRDHPGLASGPGALVAVVAVTVIAVAQTVAAFRTAVGRGWWSALAGVVVAAVLAVAAGFGGAGYASARDVDATTSGATGGVTVTAHDDVLGGVTARDSATGAERWHYWARDWVMPIVGLSGDGRTVFVVVERVNERDALAFDALSGKLRWQRVLGPDGWVGRSSGAFGRIYPQNTPGLVVGLGANQIRYIDADGREGVVGLDDRCGIIGVGGVRALYVVEQCQGQVVLFAASRDGRHLWTSSVFRPMIDGHDAVVTDNGDTVVVAVNDLTATLDTGTGRISNPRR